jgi:hypothetical protein
MNELPKVIWMLWLQGWACAPRLVQACRRSWELNNPDWTVSCLDRKSVGNFIDDYAAREAVVDFDQPPEACSDRLRIALIAQHGGVWVDATAYCLRPLNEWLLGVLGSGFFAFENRDPDLLVSSWFLAAKPGNYVAQRWSEITLEYWNGRKHRHHYFWFHHLFRDEYDKNPDFRLIWDNTPKIAGAGPAYYTWQGRTLWNALAEPDRKLITGAYSPLLKLYHKNVPQGDYPSGSVIEYLCKRVELPGS